MTFVEMRDKMIQHIDVMLKDQTHVYNVLLDKDQLYNLYLDSFPAGTNLIYRKRREHDCSCCRGFIKQFGNVVAINDGVVTSIFDFETGNNTYDTVMKAMSNFVKSHAIEDVFLSKDKKLGCHHNFEWMEDNSPKQWDHFYYELPDRFVIGNGRSKGDVVGEYHSTKDVFKNSLEKITLESLDDVLDMINDNTLYKGQEYKHTIEEFRKYKVKWNNAADKELFAWEFSVKAGATVSRIKNQAIGQLLMNISDGMDIENAVKKYEVITAPANYKRPKPIYTQKMLDDAQKKLTDMGFIDSLPRRFATLDDITVNDILFCNRDSAKRVSGANDIFGELAKNTKKTGKTTGREEEIDVDKFLSDVLPGAEKVELLLENKHASNIVSLIAPINKDSKSMFSWGNNFSWAYSGNLTDSDIKENVKQHGGKVDGVLRFSIQWNEDGRDNCDLDAHCTEPNGNEIYFGFCRKPDRSFLSGQLDVDIIDPYGKVAVENITYNNLYKMQDGIYKFYVHQFSGSVRNGFKAEIEFDGQIYSFEYPHSMRCKEKVNVAEVTLKDGKFTIKSLITGSMSSKEVFGLKTKEYTTVNAICYSPNYWENNPVKTGHKHLFFMLNGCINNERPSGIFNEFLVSELAENRKVMEALSGKMRVEDSNDQLSGVGFALDKRNDVIVKVDGKPYKIKF